MADESVSATRNIDAPAGTIFAVLADPANHAGIDGTGWVTDALDRTPLAAIGQVFRMAMYHPGHPDGDYRTANRVRLFDPPTTISWETGYEDDDGELRLGGWTWRYDLRPAGLSCTTVTLSYDWSAVPHGTRELIGFPPFPPEHLGRSLTHLAELTTR